MKNFLFVTILVLLFAKPLEARRFKIVHIYPPNTSIKIGDKIYNTKKGHNIISWNDPDFVKKLRFKSKKRTQRVVCHILDLGVNPPKEYTYSTTDVDKESFSFKNLFSKLFNWYFTTAAATRGITTQDDSLCGQLELNKDLVTIDSIKSLDVIDQYHIKNIEYKRDTTLFLFDRVDIRVDDPKNKEYYLIYKLKNGTTVEKKLKVIKIKYLVDDNYYIRINKSDCKGLSAKQYPDGLDAVLMWRNVKLLGDNEECYHIRLFPLY